MPDLVTAKIAVNMMKKELNSTALGEKIDEAKELLSELPGNVAFVPEENNAQQEVDVLTVDDIDRTLTDSNKVAPADIVGKLSDDIAAVKPKDWTLKATLTPENKVVDIDLTGCTEVYAVCADCTLSADGQFALKIDNFSAGFAAFPKTALSFIANFVYDGLYIKATASYAEMKAVVIPKYGITYNVPYTKSISLPTSKYAGLRIEDFNFATIANLLSGNVEIYAR